MSPQGHAVLTSSSNESNTGSLQAQAANTGKALLQAMRKELGFMLFMKGEDFGILVPKSQCQPDNPAGSDWQLQERKRHMLLLI